MTAKRLIAAPKRLKTLQDALGVSIRVPFGFSAGKSAPQPALYSPSAVRAVLPRSGRDGGERLSVYNEQYWFRLLGVLQEEYPLLSSLISLWEFNRLASAYLSRHPSRHPLLDRLYERLPDFLRRSPAAARWNRPRNAQAADLDHAHCRAFYSPAQPTPGIAGLKPEALRALPGKRLRLQPHVTLLREDWNLMENRRLRLENGDDFRPAPRRKKGHWAVFRRGVSVECAELDVPRFRLLSLLDSGLPLAAACEKAARGLDRAGRSRLAADISGWFAEWTAAGWFLPPR